ncbi:MAG: MarR family transcriptional regulator [Rhodanobacteraceae bacterium]
MTENKPRYEEVVIPALLRHARVTYAVAMRRALAEAGYDDVPKNGLYVLGGLAMGGDDVPLSKLIRDLRISKQAAGQLVDALVTRGYLQREIDRHDRRRLTVILTKRGRTAAAAQTRAREKIDAQLLARVGQRNLGVTRRVLAELIDIGRRQEESGPDTASPSEASR